MLRNIAGDAGVGGATPGARGAGAGAGAGQEHTADHMADPEAARLPTHPHTPVPSIFGPPPPVFRWPYDPNARLNPRDADSPQPHEETVLDLPTYVFVPLPGVTSHVIDGHSFLASFFGPGVPDTSGMLARVFGIPPGAGGDYVYSQADLDRVISQLMEQHQGNAPPPANKEVIESLPKIKVTPKMVRDGQDCAVCKEDLVETEEVTKLPCNHMYHFECVSRWLEAHDVRSPPPPSLLPSTKFFPRDPTDECRLQTCPICRHPVTPEDQRPAAPQSPGASNRAHTTMWPFANSSSPRQNRSSSGSFQPSPSGPSGDQGSGSGSRPSSHGWSGLFRRRENDRP